MELLQKTINSQRSISGVGLHTGCSVNVTFKPAPVNTGVCFVRVDLAHKPIIPANVENIIDVSKSPRRTSVGIDGVEIHTVEHLMASLSGCEVDNIIIEIDGGEVPGLDGSALPFVEILQNAGITEQDAPRKIFQVRDPIWIEEDDASIAILPSSNFRISYTLSYDHPLLNAQYVTVTLNGATFEKEIASGRTFCLQREVEDLRKQGLGKGANYDNTVVVGAEGVIDNNLRFQDEFARHKILDLIGDLYLLGIPLKGHVLAQKSGHPLNIKLVRRIAQQYKRAMAAGICPGEIIPGACELDINDIERILPHRYPFLFVDKIVELEEDKRAVGIKNVTVNDYFFQGHFPGRPVMPGVLIVEALAQVGGVLLLNKKENLGKLAFFMSLEKVKFRKTVFPGDQLRLEAEVVKIKSRTGQVYGRAYVDGRVVAEALLMFSVVEA